MSSSPSRSRTPAGFGTRTTNGPAASRGGGLAWGAAGGAAATAGAAERTAGLVLGESHLSWASVPTGLLDTYEQIRAKAGRLLAEANAGTSSLESHELKTAEVRP